MGLLNRLLGRLDDVRHDLPTIPAPTRTQLAERLASEPAARHAAFAAVLAGVCVGALLFWPDHAPITDPDTVAVREPMGPPAPPAPPPPTELALPTVAVGRNGTLDKAVRALRLPESDAAALLRTLSTTLQTRDVRPTDVLAAFTDPAGRFARAEYRKGPFETLDLVRAADGTLAASPRAYTFETRTEALSVTVEGSLYESLEKAGEDPGLAVEASDVLAWQLDFYRDVRAGDRLDVVLDRVTHEGARVKNGELQAVRWTGAAGTFEFFRHLGSDGNVRWYASDGSSARRAFLRQPLPLVRITSGFGSRKHPTLGYMKKHEGIDYGAPTGTPVWAVADGVVTFAGRKGANGNLVSVRHANGYESHYAHLSKILVKTGARVTQKQVVARVGSTGRSTGPHLHFALSTGGRMVNPLSQKFASAEPLPKTENAAFDAEVARLSPLLGAGLPVPMVAAAVVGDDAR